MYCSVTLPSVDRVCDLNTNMATWSNQHVLDFIEEYRKHECLWWVKTKAKKLNSSNNLISVGAVLLSHCLCHNPLLFLFFLFCSAAKIAAYAITTTCHTTAPFTAAAKRKPTAHLPLSGEDSVRPAGESLRAWAHSFHRQNCLVRPSGSGRPADR